MNAFEIKDPNSNPVGQTRVTPATARLRVVSFGYFCILARIALVISLLAIGAQLGGIGLSGSTALAADPIYVQQSRFLGPDQVAKDFFGEEVAISGNWAAVGARGNDVAGKQDQGAVYIFKRTGQIWAFHQKLTASDGQSKDEFSRVAMKGATLIVGAPGKNNQTGAAYVFLLIGDNWVEQKKLTAGDGAPYDRFGIAVALSQQTVVIGASRLLVGSHPGAAYVFTESGGTWSQQQKLTAADGQPYDMFGRDVAIDGETIAVTAHFTPKIPVGPGALYVFVRSGSSWSQQQKLTTTQSGGFLLGGIENDILVTGNYLKAQIWTRNGGTWSLYHELAVPDTDVGFYGWGDGSISFNGQLIVIGTPRNTMFGEIYRGSAFVFKRYGSDWKFEQKIIANDGGADDTFGWDSAISGSTLLIGTIADIAANPDQGSAYVFDLASGNSLPTITPAGPILIHQGETLNNVVIATVNDAETSAGSLKVDVQSAWAFLFHPNLISNVVNNGGQITATIKASCKTGKREIGLNVVDGQFAVGLTTLTIDVLANDAPSIGTYPNATVPPGGTITVAPSSPPQYDVPTTLDVFVLGGFGFAGTISINQTTGAVTISNAGPGGSFTIVVTLKDVCTTIVRNFSLTVLKYEAPPTIVSSLNPSASGQPVTFTVTVAPPRGAPEPTGYVQFVVDGESRGGPVRLVRGVVSATTSVLTPGEHRITAIYSGDRNYQRTSATLTQVVVGR